ncbi:hypothetical protein A8F94_01145 [Bacillus sp. FJAT-27225]|uniref:hypothetical protein n=1 Tax=Bacillus sp. FJAT-27225 TaxID=1743144 RepID=UPI00080C3449|nr:hypothetical protein [Bacillus sp. FJAT-27225]OCA90521.1 hypothetical protein A8F94_01145 [Bacillus sp. FJAT-27225]
MEHLTGKDLLEKMRELPAFEMNESNRQETIRKLRTAQPAKPKWGMFLQKAGIGAALAAVLLILPILYMNEVVPEQGQHGAARPNEQVGASGEPDYFSLRDGKIDVYGLDTNYGLPGKASIMGPTEWVAKDYRGGGKVMVFAWGDSRELVGKQLKLTAIHKKSGKELVLADMPLAGKHFDADAHILTSFPEFPTHGLWELNYEVADKPFASYSILVNEPYIEFEKATLLLSQTYIFAGEYNDLALEVEGEGLPSEIVVKIHNIKENFSQEFSFGNKAESIRATDGKVITSYSGSMTFLKSGSYTIEALGNSGEFEVRIPSDQGKVE